MAWIAGIAAIAGAALSADAAGNAADTQSEAAGQAGRLTQKQFQQTQNRVNPFINTGVQANSLLQAFLGLPGQTAHERAFQMVNERNLQRFGEPLDMSRPDHVAWVDSLVPEAQKQIDAERSQADKYGNLLKPFAGQDLSNEPGYQFGLKEGNTALLNRQANSGNMFSGNALRAASQFNQDYAGTKFDAAYNRDAANKQRIYNFLKGASDSGANDALGVGSQGAQAAAVQGNALMSGANAQAAGMVGQANAWNSALGTIYNGYQQNNALQAYNNRTNTMANQPSTSANGTYYGADFVGPRLA